MKKLVIISILLLILTIGAVSASDNATSDDTDISLNISDAHQDNLQKNYNIKVDEHVEALPAPNQIIKIYDYPNDSKGNVTITIDGEIRNLTNEYYQIVKDEYDEYWTFDATNLTFGQHDYELNFLGDEKYMPATKTGTINITPIIIDLPSVVCIEHDSWTGAKESVTTSVMIYYLTDIKGNLTLYVNGAKRILNLSDYEREIIYSVGRYDSVSEYAIKLDKSGQFYSFKELLTISKPITLNATYKDETLNIKKTGRVNVTYELDCADSVVKGEDLEIYVPKSIASKITVKIDGKSAKFYTKRVEKDYTYIYFYAETSSLGYGTHKIRIDFKGNDISPSKSVSRTFDVVYKPKTVPNTIYVYYKDSETKNIALYGFNGKTIGANQEVEIIIDDDWRTEKWTKTKSGGKVACKIPNYPNPGNHILNIYLPDLNLDLNVKLVVKHIVTLKKVTVKKSAKKLTLTATLKNTKAISGKYITFKFNGKTYKKKTNSKGIAKVTIPKSALKNLKVGKKVTYQATYLKDTVKKTVKVLK